MINSVFPFIHKTEKCNFVHSRRFDAFALWLHFYAILCSIFVQIDMVFESEALDINNKQRFTLPSKPSV